MALPRRAGLTGRQGVAARVSGAGLESGGGDRDRETGLSLPFFFWNIHKQSETAGGQLVC